MFILILHIVLYTLIFLACAFFAARQFRRMRNPVPPQPSAPPRCSLGPRSLRSATPRVGVAQNASPAFGCASPLRLTAPGGAPQERKSLRESEDKSVVGGTAEAKEEDSLWQELHTFASDPLPFLVETADADDDVVQQRAGLDARLYLRMVYSLMMLFVVLAGIALLVMLPLNLLAEKASWYPENSFLITTANGFAHPQSGLLFHTMFSSFIAVAVVGLVYILRTEMAAHVKGENVSVSPVQAYSVEVQGLRLDPPVLEHEIRTMLDAHPSTRGKVLDIQVVLDVTDLVDVVENARLLRTKLARYQEQYERDGKRPKRCTGPFSFLYIGEWVDAIEHAEFEIRASEEQATELRKVERIGTGTAFVTFTTRQCANDAVATFGDIRISNAACGHPTFQLPSAPPTPEGVAKPLCRNPNQWSMAMATKPEDVYWRNLRFNKWHTVMLSVTGFLLLFVVLSFLVTPIFLTQLFVAVGDEVIEDTRSDKGSYEAYYQVSDRKMKFNRVTIFFIGILWPLLVLVINFVVMPQLVHYLVRFFGHRQVSAMRRSAFNLICFFIVCNLLVIPGLSLSGLDEMLAISANVTFDHLLSQILFYGSSNSFFVDYVAQAGLLTAAFYFIYHTTSPLLVDWASAGKEKRLAFEFDFAYFYSSLLAVVAIGLMFASTVPIVVPFAAAVMVLRYYTDKWQLLTAHSTLRVDPAPEMTASAVHFALLLAAALCQAAFASWLWVQGATFLAIFPFGCCLLILAWLLVPYTRDNFVVVNPRWELAEGGVVEQPDTLDIPAPVSYKGSYANPYLYEGKEGVDRTSKLWGALGGVY